MRVLRPLSAAAAHLFADLSLVPPPLPRRQLLPPHLGPLCEEDPVSRPSTKCWQRERREVGRAKALVEWIKFVRIATPGTWGHQAEVVRAMVEGCEKCDAAVAEGLAALKQKFDRLPEVFVV